jgi:DNA-binding NarL/FixJ family response regulator
MTVALRPLPRRLLDRDPVDGKGRLTPTDESRTCTIIADEHRPFREGVRSYLGFGFTTVGEAGSVSELAQAVTRTASVDLVLISETLLGGGFAAAVDVIPPNAKFVVFASETRDENLFKALNLGASGYLLKNIPATRLDPTLRAVMGGEQALDRSAAARLADQIARRGRMKHLRLPTGERVVLTAREHDVAVLLLADRSTKAIADELGISSITVRRHISVLMRKLSVGTRTAAIQLLAG